jgi:long-chain fatty acid transport protein
MKTMTLRALPAILLAVFSSAATATGLQSWEQDAAGLGTAHAGSAASADTAAAQFYNPAGLSRLDGVQVSAGITGVRPRVEFDDKGSTGASLGIGDGGDAGRWLATVNASLGWRLNGDLSIGFGITSPFALDLDYEQDNWLGRMHAQRAELRTRNYNPAIAYRISERVAVGFGLNYQTIDLDFVNAASRLQGDDGSWGWNAGALFTLSPAMRVGISYRSAIEHDLEGSANGQATRARIDMPDTAILSVWQQVSDRWEAMGDLSYTRWDRLKNLNFVNRNTGVLVASEPFAYGNSWRLAWGAAYLLSDAVKLKFGIAYERSPSGSPTRNAWAPDSDALRLSLGGQWRLGSGRLDAGYSYHLAKDAKIVQNRVVGGLTNTLRGEYETGTHTLGIQYSAAF